MTNIIEVFAGGMILIFILVITHELGHLLAARVCGVGVESFSIGFGPGFKMFTLRGIPFYLCLIPLGGGVAIKSITMPGCESRGKYIEDVSLWRRVFIFFAGALGNLFLAIVIQTAIYWFAPHEVKFDIFLIKFTFVPLQGAWYFAPLYAVKTVGLLFAALFLSILTRIWLLVLPIVKMTPIIGGGVIGMMGLGAGAQSGFWSFCGIVYFVSIVVAAFQLLPCWPLDGGHIVTAFVKRIFREGRASRILCAAVKWAGVAMLVIIVINMAMSDLYGIYRYFVK